MPYLAQIYIFKNVTTHVSSSNPSFDLTNLLITISLASVAVSTKLILESLNLLVSNVILLLHRGGFHHPSTFRNNTSFIFTLLKNNVFERKIPMVGLLIHSGAFSLGKIYFKILYHVGSTLRSPPRTILNSD